MQRIYLDHAATTPVRPEVLEAMLPFFGAGGYNPSSVHAEGRAAREALDDARERVARVLGAKPKEIVFTGSGSEADNLAIAGVARALRARGRHIVSVGTEHHAVLHTLDALKDEGWEVTLLGVDSAGRVDPEAFAAALRDDTVLASVAYANNEIGTIAPIAQLAKLARAREVRFHTDAVQAPAYLPIDVRELGVDLLSIAAHKFYGPKGVGALYVREGTPVAPLLHGGGQEFAKRAGTENVAGIVGMARALELAAAERAEVAARVGALRDRLEAVVCEHLEGVRVNGSGGPRLPNNLNLAISGSIPAGCWRGSMWTVWRSRPGVPAHREWSSPVTSSPRLGCRSNGRAECCGSRSGARRPRKKSRGPGRFWCEAQPACGRRSAFQTRQNGE